MKKLWALRHVFRVLLPVILVVALVAWASVHFPLYVGIGVAILIALLIANQPRVREERERTKSLVDAAFQDAYGQLPSPPSMKISSSYGYPAFEIKFRSKAEMDGATTKNQEFKVAIDGIYKGYGPRSRPFSADMAIFFTYDGYFDELRNRYQTA